MKAIRKELIVAFTREVVSLQLVVRIMGLLASSIQVIFPGHLHYRTLQRLMIQHLGRDLSHADQIHLSREAKMQLEWWLEHMEAWNGKAIFGCMLDVMINQMPMVGVPIAAACPRGQMVKGGIEVTHPLPGTVGRVICNKDPIPSGDKLLYFVEDGQYFGGLLYQQVGRKENANASGDCQRLLALLPSASDFTNSRISSGSPECDSRLEL